MKHNISKYILYILVLYFSLIVSAEILVIVSNFIHNDALKNIGIKLLKILNLNN
jgi:hypothetical protein